MKGLVIAVVVIGVLGALFFGFITLVGKSMKKTTPVERPTVTEILQQQQIKPNDIRGQQRQLMEERQMRLRDMQRR
jgi:hypothetical protein